MSSAALYETEDSRDGGDGAVTGHSIKSLAISTGGGDAPGLNAVIESVVRTAEDAGVSVVGIRDGLDGVLHPERYNGSGTFRLTPEAVMRISATGGTILGAASRGGVFTSERSARDVKHAIDKVGVDAAIFVGGDGTHRIGYELYKEGLNIVGAPKTIDNDLLGTATTFGFDSAVECVVDSLDRLRTTVASHQRVMVVEVMGRRAGWIALHGGLAGDADAIILPEMRTDLGDLAKWLSMRHQDGERYSIVVVAEGSEIVGLSPGNKFGRLGGVGESLSESLSVLLKQEVRSLNLGHLVRGGAPVASDRLLGLRLGSAAVRTVLSGKYGVLVGWDGSEVVETPLEVVASGTKSVPLGSDLLETAERLGIYIGRR